MRQIVAAFAALLCGTLIAAAALAQTPQRQTPQPGARPPPATGEVRDLTDRDLVLRWLATAPPGFEGDRAVLAWAGFTDCTATQRARNVATGAFPREFMERARAEFARALGEVRPVSLEISLEINRDNFDRTRRGFPISFGEFVPRNAQQCPEITPQLPGQLALRLDSAPLYDFVPVTDDEADRLLRAFRAWQDPFAGSWWLRLRVVIGQRFETGTSQRERRSGANQFQGLDAAIEDVTLVVQRRGQDGQRNVPVARWLRLAGDDMPILAEPRMTPPTQVARAEGAPIRGGELCRSFQAWAQDVRERPAALRRQMEQTQNPLRRQQLAQEIATLEREGNLNVQRRIIDGSLRSGGLAEDISMRVGSLRLEAGHVTATGTLACPGVNVSLGFRLPTQGAGAVSDVAAQLEPGQDVRLTGRFDDFDLQVGNLAPAMRRRANDPLSQLWDNMQRESMGDLVPIEEAFLGEAQRRQRNLGMAAAPAATDVPRAALTEPMIVNSIAFGGVSAARPQPLPASDRFIEGAADRLAATSPRVPGLTVMGARVVRDRLDIGRVWLTDGPVLGPSDGRRFFQEAAPLRVQTRIMDLAALRGTERRLAVALVATGRSGHWRGCQFDSQIEPVDGEGAGTRTVSGSAQVMIQPGFLHAMALLGVNLPAQGSAADLTFGMACDGPLDDAQLVLGWLERDGTSFMTDPAMFGRPDRQDRAVVARGAPPAVNAASLRSAALGRVEFLRMPGWPQFAGGTVPPDEADRAQRRLPSGPAFGVTLASATAAVSGAARVLDTGTLMVQGQRVRLFGVRGEGRPHSEGLQAFLAAQGGTLTCEPMGQAGHQCRTANGVDVGALVLLNGAARPSADAPADYLAQVDDARRARRGVWAQ